MSAPAAPPTAPWPVRRTFYVSYHDVDALNHLNHATYFPWMETLRCDYYLRLTGALDPRSLDIILAEANCRYYAPVFYGAELIGEVAPLRPLGRTSFSLLYRFTTKDGRAVVAEGKTVQVCYDYDHSVKKEIPAERRAAMERDAIELPREGRA